jgi:uroporphyrinogen-III synthase
MPESPRPGVLVTRPAGRAEALLAALELRGYRCLHQPMLSLEPLVELSPAQRELLLNADRYQHIIFVSLTAIELGMDWLEHYWPQLPVGLKWYAVGRSSARRLGEFGVEPQLPETEMTSEGLLQLPSLLHCAGERVLLVRGEGGRTLLARTLEERGARVDQLALYRRWSTSLAPGELYRDMVGADVQVILLSSADGLASLLDLLTPEETNNVTRMVILVPSSRVAQSARQAGFRHVVVAADASDQSMLRALEGLPDLPENSE